MNIVICGGGVIGASVAYFLAERGIAATLVEREDVACAASGKSGGFIARDWCDGQPQAELARASFDLHAELARTLDADYGYRRIDTLLVAGSDDGGFERYRGTTSPEWLDGRCVVHSAIGSPRTTATIHPERFTRALVDAACARGARLVHGTVEGIARDAGGAVRGVRVDGAEIAADAAVITMGPWSILAARWLPLPPVTGLKGYSVVLAPRAPVPAQALFVEYESASGERTSPEIIARADGEVWACGLSSDDPLPIDPADVTVDETKCGEIARICAALSSRLDGADVLRTQACYRPICADAMPLLGAIPDVPGAYVATGHNCWGMLNAPASGRAMAELLCDGASSSVDLAPFDPARLEAVRLDSAADRAGGREH